MTKTDIPIGKIVADMRSGIGDVLIMEKYQISPAILMKIKQGLARLSAERRREASTVELKSQSPRKRTLPRNHAYYKISIRDASNTQNSGTINDITNHGIQLRGITAEVGKKLTLQVLADSFHVHAPFGFDAVCRWVSTDADGDSVAGFAITKISGPDLQQLRKLITELTISENL